MVLLISILLITLCNPTIQLKMPKQPSEIYNVFEKPLFNRPNTNATPKSARIKEIFSHNVYFPSAKYPTKAKGIQFAPFHLPSKTDHRGPTNRSTINNDIVTSDVTTFKNTEHLEPRYKSDRSNLLQNIKCYKTVQEKNVLSSVSRSPGHNAVYRSYAEIKIPMDRYLKINHNKPNTLLGKPQIPIIATTESLRYRYRPVTLTNKRIDEEFYLGTAIPKYERSSIYSKFHKIFLNIARVYSPGYVSAKSPVVINAYSMNFDDEQGHLQPLLLSSYQKLTNEDSLSFQFSHNQ